MKRLMSGTVLLGAVLAAAACNNVTSDLSGSATRIIATPTFLIGDTAAAKSVFVQTFDDQGMPVVGAATVGTVTGTITAVVDTAYRPGGQPVVTKIDVKGTGLGVGSFTTTANGLTATINVDVQPPADNEVGTVNDTLPTQGDTLTFTINPGEPYRITSASLAYIGAVGPAGQVTLVDVAIDSLSARIVADSLRDSVAVTISGTILNYAPTIGTYNVKTRSNVSVLP